MTKLVQKFSLIPFAMFFLSMIGARGPCWWDDYHPTRNNLGAGPCLGVGEQLYFANCAIQTGTPGKLNYCHWPTFTQCGGWREQAEARAASFVQQSWYRTTLGEFDNGQMGVTTAPADITVRCGCALQGEGPPKYPFTAGSEPGPMCSDIMGTAPTCGESGASCGLGNEPPCCSGLCSLSVCE